jgi:hypothetical protein
MMTGEEKAVLEEEVLGSTEQTSGFGAHLDRWLVHSKRVVP